MMERSAKLKIVSLNKDPKPDPVKALSKALGIKWRRRDKIKAEKKYGIPLK